MFRNKFYINNRTLCLFNIFSIYQFIQLKDKRDKNLIDYKQTDEGHYGWVKGNDKNGFEAGVYADDVYSLTFTNEMEYLTEISD